MSDRIRTDAPRRWTPGHWCQAHYAALGVVFVGALLLLLMRAMTLLAR